MKRSKMDRRQTATVEVAQRRPEVYRRRLELDRRRPEIYRRRLKRSLSAVSAKWEPPHGRFQHFFYPWSEYVKVGAVLRYCAYEVMALHGVLHSEIQAPYNLRVKFRLEIQDVVSQAAELVRCLGKDINNMNRTLKTSLLKRLHASGERLQSAIDMHSYLLTSTSHDAHEKPVPKAKPPENPSPPPPATTETYHEMMRKSSKRLHSWPSREVDVYEDEGAMSNSTEYLLPKMRALESTTALSLATFASLIIEFVARLDHLVDAVEELASMAKFKSDIDL